MINSVCQKIRQIKSDQVLINELIHLKVIEAYFDLLYAHLRQAQIYYPEFRNWFYEKVVPDSLANNRKILIEERDNKIAGIAIVKKVDEKKLSTLRVMEAYQNRGIGLKLFERAFEVLESDKPFLTVSEEKLPEFDKLFKYYGFKLTSVHSGFYRHGKKEFFFNEGR